MLKKLKNLVRKYSNLQFPGPKPWPIIGNLFHLATVSDNTTLSLGILAEKYGEIYSLRIGFRKMGW